MDSKGTAGWYDAYYYAHSCGPVYQRDNEWLQFFGGIADRIIRDFEPRTVLDAGCAMGFLVEALRAHRIEAFGIDLSEYAIQNVHPSVKPYCAVGSVTEPLDRIYDVIVCIEVVEHLSPHQADVAIENFCQHSKVVLFSSTPIDYKEVTHLNVQSPEYWAQLFAQHGFLRDLDIDATFVTPWAAYFRHRDGDLLHRVVQGYERKLWLLQKGNSDLRDLNRDLTREMRDQLLSRDQKIQTLDTQLTEMRNSEIWRLATILQRNRDRFAPKNSLRKRLLDKFVQSLLERG